MSRRKPKINLVKKPAVLPSSPLEESISIAAAAADVPVENENEIIEEEKIINDEHSTNNNNPLLSLIGYEDDDEEEEMQATDAVLSTKVAESSESKDEEIKCSYINCESYEVLGMCKQCKILGDLEFCFDHIRHASHDGNIRGLNEKDDDSHGDTNVEIDNHAQPLTEENNLTDDNKMDVNILNNLLGDHYNEDESDKDDEEKVGENEVPDNCNLDNVNVENENNNPIWESFLDPNTKSYYYFNKITSETTWEKPSNGKYFYLLSLENIKLNSPIQNIHINTYILYSKYINS